MPADHCPACGAGPLDPATLYVHEKTHAEPFNTGWARLGKVPFVTMPAIGKLLTEFAEEFAAWTLVNYHDCVADDCRHKNRDDCARQLVADYLKERANGKTD